jgi:hypothetical protein
MCRPALMHACPYAGPFPLCRGIPVSIECCLQSTARSIRRTPLRSLICTSRRSYSSGRYQSDHFDGAHPGPGLRVPTASPGSQTLRVGASQRFAAARGWHTGQAPFASAELGAIQGVHGSDVWPGRDGQLLSTIAAPSTPSTPGVRCDRNQLREAYERR